MFKFLSKPKRPPTTTELVSQVVATWAGRARTKDAPRGAFVLDGTPLADADLGDATTLLPLIAWHADNLYRYAINDNGLGATFHPDADAMLSRTVNLDRVHRSAAEMLCFTIEALEDARTHLPRSQAVKGAVELRGLVNQFSAALGIAPTPDVSVGSGNVKPQA